ncbi:PEP-CTERM sorting domain-containing protein [Colwellia sp. 1_MG-2023]|uniref:PEP-CTERM sorting domain-containing protein n=1 Tax=Colwellia sp. 1_MG-2023 TaxID=3062649 RepID=UPI0026E3E786|nr:PEP-CTERM sorting domain-containing protein [Colwellia sp. 1_MG-2023]MDO6446619.1 PEP-CTERM sorting domain-containing protein [Colwellia sp. 1_MG-2023]
MKLSHFIFGCSLTALTAASNAGVIYTEDFEGNDNTWVDYNSSVINTPSGAITASDGNHYGLIEVSNENQTGAFTRFGGYSTVFGNGFSTSLDVYIDPTVWSVGNGFDYSSAVNDQDNFHQRDFIFQAGQTANNGFVINASNNSNFDFNEGSLINSDYYEVTTAGWYTLEHVFYNLGGVLAVDFNILDGAGSLLHSETRSSAADDIATVVGGNRYGWVTYTDMSLAIDNSTLITSEVPEPSTLAIFALGMIGLASRRFKK